MMSNMKTEALCCMRNLKTSIPIHHLPVYLQYFGIQTFILLFMVIDRTELTLEQYISKWYQHSPLFSYNGTTITFSPRQYVVRYIPISLRIDVVVMSSQKSIWFSLDLLTWFRRIHLVRLQKQEMNGQFRVDDGTTEVCVGPRSPEPKCKDSGYLHSSNAFFAFNICYDRLKCYC